MIFKKAYLTTLFSVFIITSCGGGNGKSEAVEKVNRPPTVSITGLGNINENQNITITAQVNDPDGDQISEFNWSFTTSYDIKFTKKNNEVSFIAPDVEEDVELNINLIVKDPLGLSAEANHKVTIFNLLQAYNITTNTIENGMISPASISIEEGESYTFSVIPEENYEIESIYGCSGELNGNSYTTSPIYEACEITASFRLIPLSKQANIQTSELAHCLDSSNYTTIDEVILLNCSGVTEIQGLGAFYNLNTLELHQAKLSGDVIFPQFPKLTYLSISQDSNYRDLINNIDIKQNTALEYIQIAHMGITTLDLNLLSKLKELHLIYNNLSEIDLSTLQSLNTIHIYNNHLSDLDISNNLKLTHLFASNNNLSDLNLGANIELIQVELGSNNLSTIDLTDNINLKYLNIGNNALTDIDLSHNIELIKVWLHLNIIEHLDFSENTNLDLVWAQDNRIETVIGIENIIDTNVYFSIYGNSLSSDTLNYLENLRNNMGYSKIRWVE